MKKLYLFCLLFSIVTKAQTITFKGCVDNFGDQTFTFNKTGTDATGRNIFETTPIDGNQSCPMGICEFKILWNSVSNRWEFLADDGSGGFSNPFLMFYNTAASTLNPPDLTLGVWAENTADTFGTCNGNLTSTNATLTGAVQSTVLNTDEFNQQDIVAYPNPVKDLLYFKGNLKILTYEILSITGAMIGKGSVKDDVINLNHLPRGLYIIKLGTSKGIKTLKILK